MNIVGRRRLWYAISLGLLIPGVILLVVSGLRLGIDFTGGSIANVRTDQSQEALQQLVADAGAAEAVITTAGPGAYQIRSSSEADFERTLNEAGVSVESFERVGPSVSRDLTINALISLLVVMAAITVYIAFVFRTVEHPWRYGVMAMIALGHDALAVLGLFALLGATLGIEVDSFIVTAILTVIGFSVHDTIVVFDRLRENLLKRSGDFATIVNDSINDVMGRSLNTAVTAVLVLLALFLFGGSSTSTFILALLVGLIAGTYSSIFIAAPLLVSWDNYMQRRQSRAA